MKKTIFLFFMVFGFSPGTTSGFTDHLVLSQVQISGGVGFTTNDFVEIYNPSSLDVELKGMRLVKRTESSTTDTLLKSWTDSTIIKAGSYYLWANSNFASIAVPADITTSGTIADNNGLGLRNGPSDTGIIIDSLAFGSATNSFIEGSAFPTNPGPNKVLQRISDTNNNSADFSITDPNPRNSQSTVISPTPTPPPTPTPTPTPPPVGEPTPPPASEPTYTTSVIISEFLPNPDGSDNGEEWVELFNTANREVDLTGWNLDDEGEPGTVGSSAYSFPSGSVIKSESFLVVVLPEGSFALNNTGGDSVRLIWPNKQVAKLVDYKDKAREDESFASLLDGVYEWTSLITKGLPNQFGQDSGDFPSELKPVLDPASIVLTEPKTDEPITGIVISEFFPEPEKSEDEFIELFNFSDKEIDLAGFILSDGNTDYKFETEKLGPQQYLIVKKAESKIALNNSGSEIVSLTDPSGNTMSQITYEDPPKNQSYNLMPDELYYWSTKITSGQQNEVVVLSAPVKPVAVKSVRKIADVNETAEEMLLPVEDLEASVVQAEAEIIPEGIISGSARNTSGNGNNRLELLLWLLLSFALNLVFCYSLVRLMLSRRKLGIPPTTD